MHSGIVSIHPKGFGFVTSGNVTTDFYIPFYIAKMLITGDTIQFQTELSAKGTLQVSKRGLKLVSRPLSSWQGTVNEDERGIYLITDRPCFVRLNVSNYPPNIPKNNVISVRLTDAHTLEDNLDVVFEQDLGQRTDPYFDQTYALARFDFKAEFSLEELHAAQLSRDSVTIAKKLKEGYADLTELSFVTIDGESSKDLDDALYVEKLPNGYKLFVAISDVSAYIPKNSIMETLAYARATSVYLPGKTVPMLPEALSTEACSLTPHQPKLVSVIEVDLTLDGQATNSKFYKAVITSRAKLTYTEVSRIITELDYTFPLFDQLKNLAEIYILLKQESRGSLDFDSPEPTLVIMETGEFRIEWKTRLISHKIVEVCMLLANKETAKHILAIHKKGLFRHQLAPTPQDWESLQKWASEQDFLVGDIPSLDELVTLVDHFKNKGKEHQAVTRVLNIMQSAIYHNTDTTHFSLDAEAYTHFTSPIRRYTDLIAHRMLFSVDMPDNLEHVAVHCTLRSKSAREAEKYVWNRIKKRIIVRDVPNTTPMPARVAYHKKAGIKIMLTEWQTIAYVPGSTLTKRGYWFNTLDEQWHTQVGVNMDPGAAVNVVWTNLEDTPLRMELVVDLVA